MKGKDKGEKWNPPLWIQFFTKKSLFQTECIWNASRLTLSLFRCTRSSQFNASAPSRGILRRQRPGIAAKGVAVTTRTRTDAIATNILSCWIEIARRGARMRLFIHRVTNTSFALFC